MSDTLRSFKPGIAFCQISLAALNVVVEFLELLGSYNILSDANQRLSERYREEKDKDSFAIVETSYPPNAQKIREGKIQRYQAAKELKAKLQVGL